jgi:hypothetical protein
MDPCKVQTIVDWATPTFIQDVQCFLGIANFYQHFIAHYSSIMPLITWLIKKDQHFSCRVEADNAFQFFKACFMSAPLLIHANSSKPLVLETNISDFAISTILSQLGEENLLHLVIFFLHRLITKFMIKNF